MKISLNWLTDYVDISLSAAALGELLTNIGLNCDGITETASDVVFELDVTSNRPDWLGHLGVAREIAAATGAAFHPPVVPDLPTSGTVEQFTRVQVQDPALCPRYTARVIRNVTIAPSPAWMVEKLQSVGLRSVNNVVDITNFVLFEYSQPLHSFDYDKLAQGRIVVRRAKPGETLTAIDGTNCRLDEQMLVIADAERPAAIAGIMGGQASEVTAATKNILLESAQFEPLNIRRTSRKLAIMSDSNYRFERGVDPVGVEAASRRACQLILQLAGGELAAGLADVWARPFTPATVTLRPSRTGAILGMEIPAARQTQLLARLGLSPVSKGDAIVCTIPSHRADLAREIDLIEEVARLEGLSKIPVARKVTHEVCGEALPQKARRQVGRALTEAGFDEAMTFTFLDAGEAELFGHARTIAADALVRKTNNIIRPALLPSLLRCCKTNQDAGNTNVSLFELSKVFPPGETTLPREFTEVALVTTRDLRDLRGAIEHLVERVAPQAALAVEAADQAGFALGASAMILLDGKPAGAIGLIAPNVRTHYGLESPLAGAWLSFDALLQRTGADRCYQPLPRFPAVRRDLSLIVEETVTWRQLQQALDAVAQPLRTGLEYVTTYRGKPIDAGKKSITVTLTYRSPEGTLRSEQVDEQLAQVVAAMKTALNAQLRA